MQGEGHRGGATEPAKPGAQPLAAVGGQVQDLRRILGEVARQLPDDALINFFAAHPDLRQVLASSPKSFIPAHRHLEDAAQHLGHLDSSRAQIKGPWRMDFSVIPTEIWERIFLFMGVAGVAKMRTLSTTCAKIGSSVLERGGTRRRGKHDEGSSISGIAHRGLDKGKEREDDDDDISSRGGHEDKDEDDEPLPTRLEREERKRRRGEGLWSPHMRNCILVRSKTATIEEWASLSRNKRLWRSVRGCPKTKTRLVQVLQDFFRIEEGSGMWHSLFRSSDKDRKERLPPIKSLQTILEVCKTPLLDVILEMPMPFIAKCNHLLKTSKASKDFATIAELALSRSLPGGIVAHCVDLLPAYSRNATIKDIPVLLALKHRWCEDWLVEAIKRLAAKAEVDMLSQIVYSEGMMPTQSADLHSALKKRLISIFSTANFQDLQYLKDSQFEFEDWQCQDALAECLHQLVKQYPYSLGHFNCSWLWQPPYGTSYKSPQRGRETTSTTQLRKPTPLEQQFDHYAITAKKREAALRAAPESEQHQQQQPTHAPSVSGKESLLSPNFLYWSQFRRGKPPRSVHPQKHFARAIEQLTPDASFDELYPAKGMGNCSLEKLVNLLPRRLGRDEVFKTIVDKLRSFMKTCAHVDLENLCCNHDIMRLPSINLELVDRLVDALNTFETLELVIRIKQSWVEFVLDSAPPELLANRVLRRLNLSYHINNADATCMIAIMSCPRLNNYIRSKRHHVREVGVTLKRLISTMINIEELMCLLVRKEVALALRECDSESCKLQQAVDEKLTIHLVPLATINCLRLLYNFAFVTAAESTDASLAPVELTEGLRAAVLHRLFELIAGCETLDDLNDIVGEYDPDSPRLRDDNPARHLYYFNDRQRDALWRDMIEDSRALQESIMAALENMASSGMPRRDLKRLPNCPWMWRQVNDREQLKFFLLQQSLLSMEESTATSNAPLSPARDRKAV